MKYHLLSASALALTLSLTTPSAIAQDEETTDTELRQGTITVTARKTEESLLDVPLSITAFGEEDIREAGIDSVADVALQTPGFSFRQGFGRTGSGQGGANSRPAVRGMSSILGAPNAAFFVDGVFVSGNITSYQLDNLERVEVIRGPQSALFGRQTFSGAVNFVTRDPGDEFTGRVTATAGEHDHYEVGGFVSGPIAGDVLKGELNARYYEFGGDYDNADGGENLGAQESVNIGGRLLFEPTSNLTFRLTGGWSEDTDGGFPYGPLGSDNLNCFLPDISGSFFGIPLSNNRSRGYFCGEIDIPETFAFNDQELSQLGYNGLERTAWRTSLQADYETEGGYTLTSVTAYNKSENINVFDNTLVPSDTPNFSIGGSEVEDFSQELRILSPRDESVRWLAGLYYYKEQDGDGFDASGTFDPMGGSNQRRSFTSGDEVQNTAVYAMVETDLTDRLTMTFEARYQEDEITATDEVLGMPGAGDRPAPVNERSVTYDSFLPRITGRYAINDNTNLYGSVAMGNKPGGFNNFPAESEFFDPLDFAELQGQFGTFDEETVYSYEIGLKGSKWDGGLNYNVAVYYLDWQDQQLTQSQPYLTASSGGTSGTTEPFIVNAGESEIWGTEIELFGNPIDSFEYRIGYSFTNAEFKDFYDENTEELFDTDGIPSGAPGDVDGFNGQVSGNKLPQTPTHQFNASGTVTFPSWGDTDWFLRGDYNYESKRYVQVHNLADTGASHILNFQTGFRTDNWTLSLFANNAFDDDTPLVATRLLDFNRTLLIPDPVRNFIFLPNRRFTFFRDFTITAPRKSQLGIRATYNF